MIVFPDTSFLCAKYREQSNSRRADAYHAKLSKPLLVSSLLILEFRQSTRFQMRLFALDRSKGFAKFEGMAMLRALQSDLSQGVFEMSAPDWADVHRIAENLSEKYTEENGHRMTDILHVATAMHLGAEVFLTFDANQRRLAEASGMEVPL
ncbi:MAG: PIN domain-containing protein [Luteolibacter sp.]